MIPHPRPLPRTVAVLHQSLPCRCGRFRVAILRGDWLVAIACAECDALPDRATLAARMPQ